MRKTDLGCWNVYNADCSARRMLMRIADKWTILVIGALQDGPVRFGALHRAVPGISRKVLTQTLRGLEEDRLIDRRVFHTSPPAVEYSLTVSGSSLVEVAAMVRDWAEAAAEVRDVATKAVEAG